jgi:NADPH-dependent curcumin reductase CurA
VSGTHRVWRLRRRPVGEVREGDLTFEEEPTPAPGPGQALCETVYLSLDPTNRIWMSDMDQYMPPVEIGDVMRGSSVARVLESRADGLAPGDLVMGRLSGWQERFVADGATLRPPYPPGLDPKAYLGPVGLTGLTAYFGLDHIGKPQAGETVVVSAAAGAVGSIAGQLAKAAGCRVVGIAGSDAKVRHVVEELGFDACVNYRTQDVLEGLRQACPDGIDVDFENVGGAILDACLTLLNRNARVVVCGLIADYNAVEPVGPRMFRNILMKRARVEGFIVSDFLPRWREGLEVLGAKVAAGELRYRVEVVDGLENAVAALGKLFTGDKIGKLMVKVAA